MSTSVSERILVTENIKQIASNELVSIDVIPFIRAQKIYFRATGLRPSCRHFVFFDRKPVDVWCRQENFETISNDPTEYGNQYNNATEHPEGTTQLFSNSNGILEGSFFLPNTDAISFRTGEREFRLIDISVYDLDAAISTAFTTFAANGLIENRRDVYLKTTTIMTTRTVTTTVARRSAGGGGGGGGEVSYDVDGDGRGDFSSYSAAQSFVDANPSFSVSRVQEDFSPGFNRNTGVRGDYDNDGEKDSPKIICTAMNNAYGFGSFRQKVWLAHSQNLSPEYQVGYHAIFLPWVEHMYNEKTKNTLTAKAMRWWGEGFARRRTADIWSQNRGRKRKISVIVERKILETLCYVTGWVIMRTRGQ